MRILTQSKAPALIAACGGLLTALLIVPSLQAGQIATVRDQYGHSIYVNANTAPTSLSNSQPAQLFPSLAEINSIINRVSNQYQLDPRLVHAVIRVESNYDSDAVSSKGAMGLMQLIPSTARRFGVQNPFDPWQNIQGGVSYLKYLLSLFGGNLPLSLAAYNAGEEAVIRSGGIPAIPETEHYVHAITQLYHSKRAYLGPARTPQSGSQIAPIVRYVDSEGVVHFTNAE